MQLPLYAQIDGNWTLVSEEVMFEPGIYEMYWDLSGLAEDGHYLCLQQPHYGWGDYVTGDDDPLEWTLALSEFSANYTSLTIWT